MEFLSCRMQAELSAEAGLLRLNSHRDPQAPKPQRLLQCANPMGTSLARLVEIKLLPTAGCEGSFNA